MARCLLVRSIKNPVPYVLFRPPVGGRWSVYCITGLGLLVACTIALPSAPGSRATQGLSWSRHN